MPETISQQFPLGEQFAWLPLVRRAVGRFSAETRAFVAGCVRVREFAGLAVDIQPVLQDLVVAPAGADDEARVRLAEKPRLRRSSLVDAATMRIGSPPTFVGGTSSTSAQRTVVRAVRAFRRWGPPRSGSATTLRRTDGVPASSRQDSNPGAEQAPVSRAVGIEPGPRRSRCALRGKLRR